MIHRRLMRFISFKKVLVIIIFILTFFYLNLAILEICKSSRIFKSIFDLGISHVDGCYTNKNVSWQLKRVLVKIPYVYEIGKKLTNKIEFETLDSAPNLKNLEYVEKQKKIDKNLNPPHIKGIVNSEFITLENVNYDFEFENWNRSHGDHKNSKFNPGKQISKKNIKNLKLIWKYDSIQKKDLDKKYITNIESNPIFINNKLISVTADWRIIANDSVTGKLIWDLQSLYKPGRRGMVSYNDKNLDKNFLFAPLGNKIYKINTDTGQIKKNFGKKGFIKSFTLVAPLIYKENLIIVGTNSISIFDLITGKKIGKFSLKDKNTKFSGGAIWGGVALDQKRGIVFATTGNPQPATYGANRPGDNKNSSSLIAFDLKKKKILWSFQETLHDLWDFDIASPPIIHNLKIKNKVYETVIALSKTGNSLILERNTGKPLFDINYKKAPISDLPGEYASPYQIYLEKPERFSKIEFGLKDFDKLSKEKRKEITKKIKDAKFGWFETPSLEKDLITFGIHGGAQWMGAALDPQGQYLYIPVNNVPWVIRPRIVSKEVTTRFSGKFKDYHNLYLGKCASCHGKKRNGKYGTIGEKQIKNPVPSLVGYYSVPNLKNKLTSIDKFDLKHPEFNLELKDLEKIKLLFKKWDKEIYKKGKIKVDAGGASWYQFLTSDDLPASNPPWGYIAKLDLRTGKIIWKAAHGDIDINDKVLKVGTENFGGVALNGSDILFMTGTDDSKAYAIDAITGKELWSFKMDAAGSAPPTIYETNGKQYVSFISTGGNYHSYKERASIIYTFGISN